MIRALLGDADQAGAVILTNGSQGSDRVPRSGREKCRDSQTDPFCPPASEDDLFAKREVCPVDYKAGAPREGDDGKELWDSDKMQLGLQYLLLRDNGYICTRGIIYYRATKQRVSLQITPEIEDWVLAKYRRCARLQLPSGTPIDLSVTNAPVAQPLNISTRMEVLSGDNVLIAGFIITGPPNSSKKVMIRGLGPSLAAAGVTNPLSDPLLELHGPAGLFNTITNDNWANASNASDIPNGFQPSDPRESVIVATLPIDSSGTTSFTAIVRGANGVTGVGLVEAYDLDPIPSAFANISTRGFVNTGNNVMIGGFILGGSDHGSRVLIRAIGPSLPLAGALGDPTLAIHDSNGEAIATNDNWKIDDSTGQSQEAAITATSIPPPNDLESAIVHTFAPGAYTAIVAGKNGGTGVGLVEVYNLGF